MDKFYVDMGIKMEGGEHFLTIYNKLWRMKCQNQYVTNFSNNTNINNYSVGNTYTFNSCYDYIYKTIPKDVCAKMSQSVERGEHRELSIRKHFLC